MSHTPGPWQYKNDGRSRDFMNKPGWNPSNPDHCGFRVYDATTLVASVNEGVNIPREECAANARLIAAAPELLEALKGLLDYTGGHDEELGHPCAIARDAIAKATSPA